MTPAGLTRLKLDEGCELRGYPDPGSPLGKACQARGWPMRRYREIANWRSLSGAPWTVGYGCTGQGINPDTVWTQAQADAELLGRVAGFQAELRQALPWFDALPPVRKDVLVNIAFNVGATGLLGWRQTLAHFQAHDWPAAAHDLRHEGTWNTQVGARDERLAVATETGSW